MKKQRVIYYEDELRDEFSTAKIKSRKIDASYRYQRNSLWHRFCHLLCYRVFATPIAFFYVKLRFLQRTVGKEKMKPYRKKGYFLYGNHTQPVGDAFLPHLLNFPKVNDTIVHPANVSMPMLGRITPYMGALPLPDDRIAYRNFRTELARRIEKGHTVVVYPEAHIWPFYTGIRPFPDTSFAYPIALGVPAFCFTNTYQKRKHSKSARIVTYIDGPFYPDEALPQREQRRELRDRIYRTMQERAKMSSCVIVTYLKKEETNDEHSILRQ